MRFINVTLLNAQSATSATNSAAVDVSQMFSGSIQVVSTAGAAGTVQVQGSNDTASLLTSHAGGIAVVTNWTSVTGYAVTVSGANTYLIDVIPINYMWLRLTYAIGTSTTGTVTATLKACGF